MDFSILGGVDSWRSVGPDKLVVWTSISHAYPLTVQRPCNDLSFATASAAVVAAHSENGCTVARRSGPPSVKHGREGADRNLKRHRGLLDAGEMDNFYNCDSAGKSMSNEAYSTDLIDAPFFASSRSSGRVAWDERGNSVWEWQTQPGVFTREISSQELTRLEAKHLALVESVPVHKLHGGWIYQSE